MGNWPFTLSKKVCISCIQFRGVLGSGMMLEDRLKTVFIMPKLAINGPYCILFGVMLYLFFSLVGCQGLSGSNARVNTFQKAIATHNNLSRLAVLPFIDLNSTACRSDFALVMQREVSARLRLKGYDVVSPEKINKVLGVENHSGNWTGSDFFQFYQKLAENFTLDSCIIGSFDSRNLDLLLVKRAQLSAEISFVNPANGQVVAGPYYASEYQGDASLLSFLANLATGNLVGSAVGALFVVADAAIHTDNNHKQMINKFIAYTAFSLVDSVPPGPGTVQVPQMLDFALIPQRRMRETPLKNISKYGFGDRLKVRLMVRDRHFVPEAGDKFIISIKTNRGQLKFVLQPEDTASRSWVGSHLFTEPDLNIETALLSVYFKHEGKEYLLSDLTLLDIKTICPDLNVVWMKQGDDIVFYPQISNISPNAHFNLQCRHLNGHWFNFPDVHFSNGYYRMHARVGERFRLSVCDRNGNCSVSPVMIVPECRYGRKDVCLRILADKSTQCNGLDDLASCIEEKLSDEFASHGKRTVSSQGACADQLLLMKLELMENRSVPSGFIFQLRDVESQQIFYKSQYIYGCGGDSLQLAAIDLHGLAEAFARFFQLPVVPVGKIIPEAPVRKETAPCDDLPLASLIAASEQCQAKGSRLMTKEEWLSRYHHFKCLCLEGEYVKNGRISYRKDKKKWEFEEIFFPDAQNRYRVRCLDEE